MNFRIFRWLTRDETRQCVWGGKILLRATCLPAIWVFFFKSQFQSAAGNVIQTIKKKVWLIWHSCQWAYRIMNCPSSVVVSLSSCHCHILCVCAVTLSTLLIIETLYFMHICTYVPSQSLAKIMLLWPLFSNWQPYLFFSLNLSLGQTVDDTDFIFGRLMHLFYPLYVCQELCWYLLYFQFDSHICGVFSYIAYWDLILFRHFLPMHIVTCIVLVLWYCQMSSGPSGPI